MSNVTITIPPFPSQDLAKLVLGYLAEEQLMTAYDEFLQASPYLDALRNEYDRIFMTSLKNILAEYRAVKIYVETCKPIILRRKLFQFTNLLEIVKFLVSNVDINKLHVQEANIDKAGHMRHSSLKSSVCDVCPSLKLTSCTCRISQCTSEIEATTLECSVETTSLADLPGNTSYSIKVAKETEPKNDISNSQVSITSSNQIKDGSLSNPVQCSHNLSSTSDGNRSVENVISSITEKTSPITPSLLYKTNELELRHRVQSINDNLNLLSHNRNDNICRPLDCNGTEKVKISFNGVMLQDVSTEGGNSNNKVTVPDSSTSENIVQQTSVIENDTVTNSKNINSKRKTRQPPLLIRVSSDPINLSLQPNNLQSFPRLAVKDKSDTLQSFPRLLLKDQSVKSTNTKTEEDNAPKITILSDVKVDDIKIPPLLKTTSSASLVKMQTLFINGTPAYKHTQRDNQAFTKDEIMAMPTIILVPASDKTKTTVSSVTQNNMLNNSPGTVSCSTTSKSLEPLVIDVSSNEAISSEIKTTVTGNSVINLDKNLINNDDGLIKTVDVMPVSHASLPKDNNIAGLKTSTPNILPPTRKSSSTPRRTSHVRVLDFTTPRRILHETQNVQEVNQCHPPPNEMTLSEDINSTTVNIINPEDVLPKVNNNLCVESTCNVNSETQDVATKEKKTSIKLYNWDAQLRALAYMGNGNIQKNEPTRTPKPKKNKKKVSPAKKTNNRSHSKSEVKKTCKSKEKKKEVSKGTKTNKESVEITDTVTDKSADVEQEKPSVPVVKPTINIISRKKWPEPVEPEKSQNKSSNSDGNIETPELERISLQNEIGAKLNISDLLETPYKQALYDIQMETPRFLGPDIPGDPLSDVKIMNIPTPRFLNTPKLSQNTPSSYSSRPTDYSSGGSYYKPDDQDYILANEIMENALSASEGILTTNEESKATDFKKIVSDRGCEAKSRPVRQCTKNVSYHYGIPSSSKIKDVGERLEKSSTCSESGNSKPNGSSTDKENVVRKKREPRNKSKKYKSPTKKETPKAFMKIKPRRTTPVKEVLGKGRKKNYEVSHTCVKPQPKKVTASKEKKINYSPIPVANVATKSRRKSSTPRKLHCTKKINSESSTVNSPDRKKQISQCSAAQITKVNSFRAQESDNEQQHLQWSDEGSQESNARMMEDNAKVSDSDDITRIKEYIEITVPSCVGSNNEGEGTLQVDLIKRGFDVETARMIERDLLETPTHNSSDVKVSVQNISQSIPSPIAHDNKNEPASKKSDESTESDRSTSNNLQIVQEDDDDDEHDDFSVYECNENTCNYFEYKYDEAQFTPSDQVKLKETFTMEICVEDDVEIRLKATSFNTVFEHDCKQEIIEEHCEEKIIETPASPIHYSTLYTPRKAQCYEIFDSTLASLDTPLKPNTPVQEFETVTEIVLEVEKLESDIRVKPEGKKRKRLQSGASDESSTGSKKVKPDTSYLLNSAGIQNIDIESVLSKLHGP